MEIYIVRHGQTEYNVLGRFTGQTDIPLNEKGRAQMAALAPYLADVTFDRVLL